jgi:hypothetical protein
MLHQQYQHPAVAYRYAKVTLKSDIPSTGYAYALPKRGALYAAYSAMLSIVWLCGSYSPLPFWQDMSITSVSVHRNVLCTVHDPYTLVTLHFHTVMLRVCQSFGFVRLISLDRGSAVLHHQVECLHLKLIHQAEHHAIVEHYSPAYIYVVIIVLHTCTQ